MTKQMTTLRSNFAICETYYFRQYGYLKYRATDAIR